MCDENVKSIEFLSLNGPVPSSVSSTKFNFVNFDSEISMIFQMKSIILGFFAVLAAANAGVVQIVPAATTLLRTPSLDSAIVRSEQSNGGFSYSTVENHAYAPVVQTVSFK
jgi:hypothetical protein